MLNNIKKDFPIFTQKIHDKNFVYLDNAATSQKPLEVIECIDSFYKNFNAPIHRGAYFLAEKASAMYENAREKVRAFINAKNVEEIIFVRGTTEAINLVAASFGRENLEAGDEIIVSAMEHHANIVSWQLVAEQKGAKLRVIPITEDGDIILEEYQKLFNEHTKIVAITHVSNVLGTVTQLKEIIKIAHDFNVPVLVDGAQAVSRMPVDVLDLDCDFYVFSGHKMYAPTGSGVLYGKRKLLEKMPPYHGGGGMIKTVTIAKTEYAELPYKFEAGTQDAAAAIALGVAIDYIKNIGMQNIFHHEKELISYARKKLSTFSELKFIGNSVSQIGVLSFVLDGVHPHDAATILDSEGIAVRAGNHCAMPLMERYQVPATTRASFGIYNDFADIDALAAGIKKALEIFG